MPRIPQTLAQQVTQPARGRCEYCQTPQAIVVEMEIDHVIPVSAAGETSLDNLCLACVGCNGFKSAFQVAADPVTGDQVDLFNPRTQAWTDHFTWSQDGSRVLGLTPSGRATVERLRMNRERLVIARQLWVQAGWHPPTA
jgi:hypothetical protein